jgi:tyrosyl-tRNA synthetase
MTPERLNNVTFISFKKADLSESQLSMLKAWGYDFAEVIRQSSSTESKSSARRLIEQKGIRINDRVVNDKHARIGWD